MWYNLRMSICKVTIDGSLPRTLGLTKSELKSAAVFFAEKSSARIGVPFRAVTVVLQNDAFSAETHAAINGVEGPTDVTTQGYDAMPPEPEGIYGELYVNVDQAVRVAPKRKDWSVAKELFLYVAHAPTRTGLATPIQFERLEVNAQINQPITTTNQSNHVQISSHADLDGCPVLECLRG